MKINAINNKQSFSGSYIYEDKSKKKMALDALKIPDREVAQNYLSELEHIIKNEMPDNRHYKIAVGTKSSMNLDDTHLENDVYIGKKHFKIKVTDLTDKDNPVSYTDKALFRQNIQTPYHTSYARNWHFTKFEIPNIPVKENLQKAFKSIFEKIRTGAK